MKKLRFSVEQIVALLKQVELGLSVSDATQRRARAHCLQSRRNPRFSAISAASVRLFAPSFSMIDAM